MPTRRPSTIREIFSLAENALATMTTGDLIGLRRDMKRLAAARNVELTNLRRLTERINDVLKSRAGCKEVEVSDHAVLRYLERIEGIDISALRGKIRKDTESALPLVGDRVVTVDGYTLCLADRQRVTTVFESGGDDAD